MKKAGKVGIKVHSVKKAYEIIFGMMKIQVFTISNAFSASM